MKVFVKWRDKDTVHEEITELIYEDQVYIKGTDISFPIETLGDDKIIFEDEYGIWGVDKKDIVEIKKV